MMPSAQMLPAHYNTHASNECAHGKIKRRGLILRSYNMHKNSAAQLIVHLNISLSSLFYFIEVLLALFGLRKSLASAAAQCVRACGANEVRAPI